MIKLIVNHLITCWNLNYEDSLLKSWFWIISIHFQKKSFKTSFASDKSRWLQKKCDIFATFASDKSRSFTDFCSVKPSFASGKSRWLHKTSTFASDKSRWLRHVFIYTYLRIATSGLRRQSGRKHDFLLKKLNFLRIWVSYSKSLLRMKQA